MAIDTVLELGDLLLAISSRSPSRVLLWVSKVMLSFANTEDIALYNFPLEEDASRDHHIRLDVLRDILITSAPEVLLLFPGREGDADYVKAEVQEFCRGLHSNQTLQRFLIGGGMNMRSDVTDNVAEMLRVNTFLTEVKVGVTNMNMNSAALIAAALRQNRTLQSLQLWVQNLDAERVRVLVAPLAATDALGSNRILQELSIEYATYGNSYDPSDAVSWGILGKFGDEGVKHMAAMLCSNSSLLTLRLIGCDITSEGAAEIGRALATSNHTLRVLDLSLNRIGADGVEALLQCISLTSLDVHGTGNEESNDNWSRAANMLKSNSTLTHLDVSNIGTFSEEDIVVLLKSLTTNTSLTSLHLQNCEAVTGDKVFATIMELLGANLWLRTLNLDNTPLDREGKAVVVYARLQRNTRRC